MSFISDLAKYVVGNVLSGEGVTGASIANFTVNKVLNSINRASDSGTATISGSSTTVPSLKIEKNVNAKAGTRIQMDPDLSTHIPVYYGEYITSGIITDAALSDDGLTMTYCFVIGEKTGQSDLLVEKFTNGAHTIFKKVYTQASAKNLSYHYCQQKQYCQNKYYNYKDFLSRPNLFFYK